MKGASAFLMGTGARLHRSIARRLNKGRAQPSCAVLSVGALTMGGAGKTPVAARLALGLSQRGHRVVLASRGYKGKQRAPVTVVSDGTTLRTPLIEAGDEPLLLSAHAPGVPVLVGRDRRRVGLAAVAQFGCEILVLDDGFQHHRLARDVDFVCIDAVSGLGNGKVFPAGPLREPLLALRDADWLCLVGGSKLAPEEMDVGLAPEAGVLESLRPFSLAADHVAFAERRIVSIRRAGSDNSAGPISLKGEKVGVLAGVGRPENVCRSVEALGGAVCATRFFQDHHAYRPKDLAGLAEEAGIWITTEKDALKILPEWVQGVRLDVLEMRVQFKEESALLDTLEAELMSRPAASISNRANLSRP